MRIQTILNFFKKSLLTSILWLKRAAYIGALAAIGIVVYKLFIKNILDGDHVIFGFLGAWTVTAYVLLPRVNRIFTKFYVPEYFIGRVKTGDGLLGDPINLAINGTRTDLVHAMQTAGWTKADPITIGSSIKIIQSVLLRKSYPRAPVSSLFLFGKKQDYAFQQEVAGNPNRRHHVRFWKVPNGWLLPGGHKVKWLAAGTYDRSVGVSNYTLQITHKIAENTDEERDYIVASLKKAKQAKKVSIIKNFSASYRTRSGGGDRIKTDGSLPIITL